MATAAALVQQGVAGAGTAAAAVGANGVATAEDGVMELELEGRAGTLFCGVVLGCVVLGWVVLGWVELGWVGLGWG